MHTGRIRKIRHEEISAFSLWFLKSIFHSVVCCSMLTLSSTVSVWGAVMLRCCSKPSGSAKTHKSSLCRSLSHSKWSDSRTTKSGLQQQESGLSLLRVGFRLGHTLKEHSIRRQYKLWSNTQCKRDFRNDNGLPRIALLESVNRRCYFFLFCTSLSR